MLSPAMSALAPISVHILIVLAAATAVAMFFALPEREILGAQNEE